MKKRIFRGMAAAVTLLIGTALLFTACPSDNPPPSSSTTPEVVSVTITRGGTAVSAQISALPGAEIQFGADVVVKNGAAQTVTWGVSDNSDPTTTITGGLLAIGEDEEADTVLTVTATSTADSTKKGTAKVKVLSADAPVITDVTVSAQGNAATVQQGATLQFTATVEGNNLEAADKAVAWSISSTGHKAGTTVSAAGLLTVAGDETVDREITVKATPNLAGFETHIGQATVTVTAAGGGQASPVVIEDFDGDAGISATSNNWWSGYVADKDGRKSYQVSGDDAATRSVARINGEGDVEYEKDITELLATYPTLSLFVLTDSDPALNACVDTFTFELLTGENGETAWAAPDFTIVRYLVNTNSSYESGWVEMKIPLADFKNGDGDPISSLSELVITGWRLTCDANNVWVGEIRLIQETVATGYKPQGEIYTVSQGAMSNGEVAIRPEKAPEGASIMLRPTPDIGFEFEDWGEITPATVVPELGAGGNYYFDMPAENVSIVATFIESTEPLYSSVIIDDFSYITGDGAGATDWGTPPGADAYGFEFIQNQWWGGYYPALNIGDDIAVKPGVQNGGSYSPAVARINENITFINDITPLIEDNPTVSFLLYIRGADKSGEGIQTDEVTFELHTGNHPSAFTAYSVTFNSPLRTVNARGGTASDKDSDDWMRVKIPLSMLLDAESDPITDLDQIVITGWKIGVEGALNFFFTDIKLLEDVVTDVTIVLEPEE